MKLSIFICLFLVFVGLSCRALATPINYGSYLESTDWNLDRDKDGDLTGPKGGSESFGVWGPSGKPMQITALSSGGILIQLSLHQLALILDLPATPRWPVIFERGMNGTPSLAESVAVFPTALTLADHTWVGGLVGHRWQNDSGATYENGMVLTPEKLAQFVQVVLFDYLIGATSIRPPLITRESTVYKSPSDIFNNYLRRRENNLRDFTRAINLKYGSGFFPVDQIRLLTTDAAALRTFLLTLNLFLSRVEMIVETRVGQSVPLARKLLEPALQEVGASGYQTYSQIQTVARGLRNEVRALLGGIHPGFRTGFPPRIQFDKDPYTVDFGSYRLNSAQQAGPLTGDWMFHAKDYLLKYILSPPSVRQGLVRAWAQELHDENPLRILSKAAAEIDNRIYLASPDPYQARRAWHTERSQWFVNHSIEPTLIVVSPNDAESRHILSIAEELRITMNRQGKEKIHIYQELLNRARHTAVTAVGFSRILEHAISLNTPNIILCEPGDIPASFLERARVLGKNVVVLDHHQEHVSKLSTLEQFANSFGYQLSLDQYVTAMLDQAGIRALAGFAHFTLGDIREMLNRSGLLPQTEEIIARIEPFLRNPATRQPVQDALIRIRAGNYKPRLIALALEYFFFPRFAHLLIESRSQIHFFGNRSVCPQIRCAVGARIPGDWVEGGSLEYGSLMFAPEAHSVSQAAGQFERALRSHVTYSCATIFTDL